MSQIYFIFFITNNFICIFFLLNFDYLHKLEQFGRLVKIFFFTHLEDCCGSETRDKDPWALDKACKFV